MGAHGIVLLSGGLDSATALALCLERGDACTPLAIDYAQRHLAELAAARNVAAHYGLTLRVARVAAPVSVLTGAGAVPKGRSAAERGSGLSPTYVPARNTLFLAHALGLAESLGADAIVVGATAEDRAGFPDCRPEFFAAFERVARCGTRPALRVEAPLADLSKADVIREAARLEVPIAATWSCYDPQDARPCGACDACLVRADGFAAAGVVDPAVRL